MHFWLQDFSKSQNLLSTFVSRVLGFEFCSTTRFELIVRFFLEISGPFEFFWGYIEWGESQPELCVEGTIMDGSILNHCLWERADEKRSETMAVLLRGGALYNNSKVRVLQPYKSRLFEQNESPTTAFFMFYKENVPVQTNMTMRSMDGQSRWETILLCASYRGVEQYQAVGTPENTYLRAIHRSFGFWGGCCQNQGKPKPTKTRFWS